MDEPDRGFAFLEHTADVGIRAWAPSVAAAFEQAGQGLVTLMDASADPPGRSRLVRVEGTDLGGLLVAFLDELIYLCETMEDEGVADVRVTRMDPAWLELVVDLAPRNDHADGLLVKAATFHQLLVDTREDGRTEIQVYLDV
jgi:SHS2 domain-containing protein